MTPMMQQYSELKKENPDCLLFFRLGDFYELFFEDALSASTALDITLTKRGRASGEEIPMCGVPFHAADSYIARLVRQGFRVAICEQTESPEDAKKRGGYKAIVKREVTRIVTPGTLTESQMLSANRHNYLALICDEKNQKDPDQFSFAVVDISTGDFFIETCPKKEIINLVSRVMPVEMVIPERLLQTPELFELFREYKKALTPIPDSRFDGINSQKRLQEYYDVRTLDGFGSFKSIEVTAASALLDYVKLTQKGRMPRLALPKRFQASELLEVDTATRRNLELVMTSAGSYKGSLMHLIDRTKTATGARLLGSHLANPLKERGEIEHRQESVSFFVHHSTLLESMRGKLSHFSDLERALSRLSLGRGGPRDLDAIRVGLKAARHAKDLLVDSESNLGATLKQAYDQIRPLNSLIDRLDRALQEDLPVLARDGNFIRPGYLEELDQVVQLRDQGKELISKLQDEYRAQTQIPSLKIKHNNLLGFYIEVTNSNADKVPFSFIHRQTMASAMRYTSKELAELEQELSSAQERALSLELRLYEDLVQETMKYADDVSATAQGVAIFDVAQSHAYMAITSNYTCPQLSDGLVLDIQGGRHPVVEKALGDHEENSFIANECHLGDAGYLSLLTGPNMAGKSTYLRQNALIIFMAQIGSYVPARSATIGVVDRLFSRVGASDDLARGRSTFMVEMVETAAILNQATDRSFVILDEVGRGTSTHDGLSLAWAILEHLHANVKCRTLFATHYHELTQLEDTLENLICYTMKIKEWQGRAVFLHEVMRGRANKSYGLYVAKMAGVPDTVLARAQDVLETLEKSAITSPTMDVSASKTVEVPQLEEVDQDRSQQTLFSVAQETIQPHPLDKLASALDQLNPDQLSPREALMKLYELKETVDQENTPVTPQVVNQ